MMFPAPARAHSLSDELTVGGTNSTSAWVMNRIGAAVELRDFTLRGAFAYTHDTATPPSGGGFGTSASDIFFLSLGGEWQGKHFDAGIEGFYSPPSASTGDSTLPESVDAQLSSDTSSAGGSVWLGYDTNSDSKYQTYADLMFTASEFLLDQKVLNVWSPATDMPVGAQAYCQSESCTAPAADLFQGRIAASVTETLLERVDLRLAGAYYFYDRDPTTVGGFSQLSRGRSSATDAQVGSPLAVAPWSFTVQPSATWRRGPLALSVSFQYGQYVSDSSYSYDLSLGVRAQYKVSRKVRLWLKAVAQRDVYDGGTVSWGGAGSAGARFSF